MGSAAAGTAARQGADRQPRARSGNVSRQIAQQRRGYAGAVLRSLAATIEVVPRLWCTVCSTMP